MTQERSNFNLMNKNKEIKQLKKDNAFLRRENTRLRKQNYELMKIGKALKDMIEKTFKQIETNNLLAAALNERRNGLQYN